MLLMDEQAPSSCCLVSAHLSCSVGRHCGCPPLELAQGMVACQSCSTLRFLEGRGSCMALHIFRCHGLREVITSRF